MALNCDKYQKLSDVWCKTRIKYKSKLLKYQLFHLNSVWKLRDEKASERELSIIVKSFITNGNLKRVYKTRNWRFSSLNSIAFCCNNFVISSHCIARFCRCRVHKTRNRKKIHAEGSLLKNHFCAAKKKEEAQRNDFCNSSTLFIPKRSRFFFRSRWPRLATCQSYFCRNLTCRCPWLVRQSTITSRKQRRHAAKAEGGC